MTEKCRKARSKLSIVPSPALPLKPSRSQTMMHDYKRNGTATLSLLSIAANGEVYDWCQERHRHQKWLKFLRLLDQAMQAPPLRSIAPPQTSAA